MKKAVVLSAVLVGATVIGASAFAASSVTSKMGTHFGRGFAMSGTTMSGREMPKFKEFAFSGITDAEKATLTSFRDAQKAEQDAVAKLSDSDKAEMKTLRDAQEKEMQALRDTQQKATRAFLTTKGVTVVSDDLHTQARAIMEKYRPTDKDGEGFGPGRMGNGMGMREGFKHGGKMRGHEESSTGSTEE